MLFLNVLGMIATVLVFLQRVVFGFAMRVSYNAI